MKHALVLFVIAILVAPPASAVLDALTPPNAERMPGQAQRHGGDQDGGKGGDPHRQQGHDADVRAGDFGIRFRCPTVGNGATGQEIIDSTTCPYMVRDEHDIITQPSLVVDPFNFECQAFHAMHGGRGVHVGTQPPSHASRDNDLHQPHTMFRWCNDGEWEDNPYYVHESLSVDGRTVFGEDSDAVLDKKGNINLGGIVAYQGPEDPDYRYVIFLHRLGRANTQPAYDNPTIIETETPYAKMSQLQMAYVRDTDRVVVSWIETEPSLVDEESEQKVRTVWASGENRGVWEEIGSSNRVGPCLDISEMVPRGELLFMACRPAPGYFGQGGNFTGRFVQMHAFDTTTWATHRVSQTPISDGHLKLIDGHNGWQILLASGTDANDRPFAQITSGALGSQWSKVVDYAADFMDAADAEASGSKMLDARITAAVHDDTNHIVHVIWAERYEIDPLNPDTINAQPMAKTYAAVRAQGGFLGNFDLGYGGASRVMTPQGAYQGGEDGIFWDKHDSIVQWRDPRGGPDRFFVAFGDYGSMRLGEAVPEDPPLGIPFPPAAIPAIPLAAASTSASTATAALAATLGLMLLSMLAARKKAKVETPTL